MKFHYSCSVCGAGYNLQEVSYTCRKCGETGLLDVIYDYDALKKKGWLSRSRNAPVRYQKILPIVKTLKNSDVPLQVGDSPVYNLRVWEKSFSQKGVLLFDDTGNPTASYKDRASVIACIRAREEREPVITCASTGNAGSSLAGMTAAFRLKSIIFVPETAPVAKIVQLMIFGAKLFRVAGNYDTAYDLCLEATKKFGWYNRSTGFNPILLEGKKTSALEIFEKCRLPDRIYVPVGDGCIIGGVYKGFLDLKRLGLISEIPFLVGVQAAGSDSYCRSVKAGYKLMQVAAETVADSISVDIPRAFSQAIRIAKEKKGHFMTVSDSEIQAAQRKLAAESGVFAEPAAAAAAAGFIRERESGILNGRESVLLLITGNGLKDVKSVLSYLTLPEPVKPKLAVIEAMLEKSMIHNPIKGVETCLK
ncbi:MAG: pyridoxal-phosphate dependent enzyme [Candidatus Wallbacteria bacterium]|nr:pyridoxal-phosphate dependent enzyme [Candidatus Wallbacteria bacterium]